MKNKNLRMNGLVGIRTPGQSVKSRLLYLAELQAHKRLLPKKSNYTTLDFSFKIFLTSASLTFDIYLASILSVTQTSSVA